MKNILPILFSTCTFFVSTLFALIVGEGFLRLKNLDMKNYDMEMWKYAKSLKGQVKKWFLVMIFTATINRFNSSIIDITLNNPNGMRGDEISESKSNHRIIF